MDPILKNEIIPPLLFFVAFSVVFIFLEIVLVFVLNSLGRKYWEFVVDVVIRSQVHYGRVIRVLLIFVLAAILAAVVLLTPLVDVLVRGTGEMRLFALVLALMMVLFYLVTIRKTARMELERNIYRIVFFLVSIALYIVILGFAERSYGDYVRYVNANFINPTVETVGKVLEDRERENLLSQFREMNQRGLCVVMDFTQSKEAGLMSFVWIKDEPSLAYGTALPDSVNNPKGYLGGRVCTNGKDTFLLTEWGSWYWVIR